MPKTGVVYDLMRKTKLDYHYAVQKLKRQSEQLRKQRMAEALAKNNSRDFWKEVKTVNGNQVRYPTHIGNRTEDSDIASLFASKYKDLYNSVPSDGNALDALKENVNNGIGQRCISEMFIDDFHISRALKHIQNNKADSEYTLFSNHILYASPLLHGYLKNLYNGMIIHGHTPTCITKSNIISIPKDIRGDLSSDENYRGISLCSSVFKIFELILVQLQGPCLYTSDMQFAYKKAHSTTMSTLVLKDVINHFLSNNSNVFCCFIDASKAFDRLRYDKLFDILLKRDVHPLMIRILMNVFEEQTVQTSWRNVKSEAFTCQNGVRQGGILSPLLYSVYNDILLERLKSNGSGCWMGNYYFGALSYADDLCILSPTVSGLKDMLDICEEYGTQFDVMYNPKKTKCMKFSMNMSMNKDVSGITLCGKKLEWVTSFKYLGNWVTSNLKENIEISNKTCAFFGNVNSLKSCFGNVGYRNISILYNSYCCHYYGCQAWRLGDRDMKRFYTAWNKAVRYLCSLPYDTHTEFLPYVVDTLNVKEQVYMRSANLIRSMKESQNKTMNFLVNNNLYNMNTIIGENWCLIRNYLQIETFDCTTKYTLLRRKYESMTPECGIIIEMLDVLSNDVILDGFEKCEIEYILYDLCKH